jgi:hypothetical protein
MSLIDEQTVVEPAQRGLNLVRVPALQQSIYLENRKSSQKHLSPVIASPEGAKQSHKRFPMKMA